MTLRIHQYAYFSISSETMSAEEIAARIGLDADRKKVRGSRSADPAVPSLHRWHIDTDDRSLRLDEQVQHLISRLLPYQDAIRDLVEEQRVDGARIADTSLLLVRHLDHEEGVVDGWQHRLLGWWLDEQAIGFLAHVRATVDVDEYGQDPP